MLCAQTAVADLDAAVAKGFNTAALQDVSASAFLLLNDLPHALSAYTVRLF